MLLNRQLWAVYHVASHYDTIRALFLYPFEEGTELAYQFIVICEEVSSFFCTHSWIDEIETPLNIEKEWGVDDGNQDIFFNCYVRFKTAWSSQFIFIKKSQFIDLVNQQKVIALIDKDGFIKPKRYQLKTLVDDPLESSLNKEEFKMLVLEFYCESLRLCRLIVRKQPLKEPPLKLKELIVHLVWWLNHYGIYVKEDELKEIESLLHRLKQKIEVINLKQLLSDVQLIANLLERLCLPFKTSQIILLTECIKLLQKEEKVNTKMDLNGDKFLCSR